MTAADAHEGPDMQVIAPGSDDHYLLDAAISARVQPMSLPHAISASGLWKIETRWIADSLNVSFADARPRFALRVTTPASVATTVMVTGNEQLLRERARAIAQEWVDLDQVDTWSAKNFRITPKHPGRPAPPTKHPSAASHNTRMVVGAVMVAAVGTLVIGLAWLLFSIAAQPLSAPAPTGPFPLDDDQLRGLATGMLMLAVPVGGTVLLIWGMRR